MVQQRLFNGKGRNGRKGPPKLGVGSCVWVWIEPSSTRTPNERGFRAPKGWRWAKVHAYGRPFKDVWVKLIYRSIGNKDLERAHRLCAAKTKPKSPRAGMTPDEFVRRAGGKMGKYQLETCREGR